jgi:hypothetical protein
MTSESVTGRCGCYASAPAAGTPFSLQLELHQLRLWQRSSPIPKSGDSSTLPAGNGSVTQACRRDTIHWKKSLSCSLFSLSSLIQKYVSLVLEFLACVLIAAGCRPPITLIESGKPFASKGISHDYRGHLRWPNSSTPTRTHHSGAGSVSDQVKRMSDDVRHVGALLCGPTTILRR